MKKNALILLVILLLAGTYTYFSDYDSAPAALQDTAPVSTNYTAAPDFSFQDLNGKSHTLADFKGKIVVLNFWASWCAPCVVEFPEMLALAKKLNKDTVFVFLSVDDKQEDIQKFLKRPANKMASSNIYIGWDQDKQISQSLFQTYKYPETYVITPNSLIAEKIVGAISWGDPAIEQRILSYAKPQ